MRNFCRKCSILLKLTKKKPSSNSKITVDSNDSSLLSQWSIKDCDIEIDENQLIIPINSVLPPNKRFGHVLEFNKKDNLRKVLNEEQLKLASKMESTVKLEAVTFGPNLSFTGEWKNQLPNGKGTLKILNETYNGEFVNGFASGKGVWTCEDEQIEGTFEKGTANGEVHWSNENSIELFVGTLIDDIKVSKGYEVWKNGTIYKGDFDKQGCRTGKASIIFPNGIRYTGDVVNSKCTGNGTIWWGKSTRYVGTVSENKVHGRGTLKSTKLRIKEYEGEFNNGTITGSGIMTLNNSNIKYKGKFVNGLLDGLGVQIGQWGNKDVKGVDGKIFVINPISEKSQDIVEKLNADTSFELGKHNEELKNMEKEIGRKHRMR